MWGDDQFSDCPLHDQFPMLSNIKKFSSNSLVSSYDSPTSSDPRVTIFGSPRQTLRLNSSEQILSIGNERKNENEDWLVRGADSVQSWS